MRIPHQESCRADENPEKTPALLMPDGGTPVPQPVPRQKTRPSVHTHA